jgi:outer membrane biosynthesis protein TonB
MSRQRSLVSLLLAISVGLGAAVAVGESVESLIRRYPYDPACLWGRLANGKGTVIRCLSEKEANVISAVTAVLPTSAAAPAPSPAPAETATSDASAPASTSATETATTKGIQVTVGPLTADKGELGLGKLAVPKDRYAKCVEDNGGLKGTSGEVHVRFLVRSKGVAEGVSVQKRSPNVSVEAARCIAEVVDRRRVGVPDEPLVGATLVIKLSAP